MKTMQFSDASLQTTAVTMLEYKDCYKGAIGKRDDEGSHSERILDQNFKGNGT